jgi:hypothetical protein
MTFALGLLLGFLCGLFVGAVVMYAVVLRDVWKRLRGSAMTEEVQAALREEITAQLNRSGCE